MMHACISDGYGREPIWVDRCWGRRRWAIEKAWTAAPYTI